MRQKDSEGNQHAKGTALREEQEVHVHIRRDTHNKYTQLYTIWASFGKFVSHSTDLEKSERGMLPSAVSVVEGVRQGLQRG